MIEAIQPSGARHHSLHSGDAGTVRREMAAWVREQRTRLQEQIIHTTDQITLLRIQGALQTLDILLRPLEERPEYARTHQEPEIYPRP